MTTFLRDIKDVEVLLALSPEDIAPIVLRTADQEGQNNNMHLQNLANNLYHAGRERIFPDNRRKEVELALAESWSWLTQNGLIMEEPGFNGRNGFMVLTKAGKEFLNSPDHSAHLKSLSDFPKALLHPSIVDEIWAVCYGETLMMQCSKHSGL